MVNVKPVKLGNTERMSFGKIDEVIDMPNLIDIQKASYKWLLDEGLKEVFKDVSGITDYQDNLVLDFIDYTLDVDHPNYSVIECKVRDATYSAALRVTARLLNKSTGEIKESNVFMGDFPLMTASGTFVINGAERVIVSQLVRSPGVYYKMDHDKTGKELYSTTVIPNRGAWLEYETDVNDVFYVRIDKNRKLPVTSFIRALGLGTDAEILDYFGDDERMRATIEKDAASNVEEGLIEVYKKLRPGEPPTVESAVTHLNNLFFDAKRYDLCRFGRYKYNKKLGIASRLAGHILDQPVINPLTGEIMAEAGETVSYDKACEIEQAGVEYAFVNVEAKEYYTNERGETAIRMVERTAKIIGNCMVDISGYVDFDAEKYGINEKVSFKSDDPAHPAKFYMVSAPAHCSYENKLITIEQAAKRPLGSVETCNKRVINQYIHPAVMQSCQLCMGMTQLAPGSNWNSMPCHTHERRMEVYFYFDLKDNNVVFHMMGEPTETRHLLMHNEQAVISPSWSIHTGVGTSNYTFIWGMCGENQEFDDMDNIDPIDLR